MTTLLALFVREEGSTAVEYSVILALILMSVIAAIGTLGAQSGGMWAGNNQALSILGN